MGLSLVVATTGLQNAVAAATATTSTVGDPDPALIINSVFQGFFLVMVSLSKKEKGLFSARIDFSFLVGRRRSVVGQHFLLLLLVGVSKKKFFAMV